LAWWRLKSSSSPWDLRWDPLPNVLAISVLTWKPTKGSTLGRRLWPRQDRELDGETCGTPFRQVRSARCVIPYVIYVV
jgi:hypothetical protein